jgi:hypothetical protein
MSPASTPAESAQLLLKLYELRREPTMRQAREWFRSKFFPRSMAEIGAMLQGEHNPQFRMVVGYWDMACSLVTHAAIDQNMFVDANPESVAAYSKIEPFLEEMRTSSGLPFFLKHWEAVMRRLPDLDQRLAALRSPQSSPAEPADTDAR